MCKVLISNFSLSKNRFLSSGICKNQVSFWTFRCWFGRIWMFYCETKINWTTFLFKYKWLNIGESSWIIIVIIQLVGATHAKISSKKGPLHSQILKQKQLLPWKLLLNQHSGNLTWWQIYERNIYNVLTDRFAVFPPKFWEGNLFVRIQKSSEWQQDY